MADAVQKKHDAFVALSLQRAADSRQTGKYVSVEDVIGKLDHRLAEKRYQFAASGVGSPNSPLIAD